MKPFLSKAKTYTTKWLVCHIIDLAFLHVWYCCDKYNIPLNKVQYWYILVQYWSTSHCVTMFTRSIVTLIQEHLNVKVLGYCCHISQVKATISNHLVSVLWHIKGKGIHAENKLLGPYGSSCKELSFCVKYGATCLHRWCCFHQRKRAS